MLIEIEKRLKDFFSGKTRDKNYPKIMKTYRILILEDDIKTLSVLTDCLAKLEDNLKNADIAITVLAEYTQVEEYINKTAMDFDIIVLDRDCKSCGSFHILNFKKFGVDRIISISAIPQWNKEAMTKGIKKVVLKDLNNLDGFADRVVVEIKKMI